MLEEKNRLDYIIAFNIPFCIFSLLWGFCFVNPVLLITSQTVYSDSVEGGIQLAYCSCSTDPHEEEEEAAAVEEERCGSAVSINELLNFTYKELFSLALLYSI